VRRLVLLLIVALLGAGFYGSQHTTALRANGASVSARELRTELSAIASTPTLQCYLTAMDPVNFASGAGAASIANAGAAAWSNLRLEGLTIDAYVAQQLKYRPSASDLATATTSLEDQMAQSAATNSFNCPGSPALAVAAMPVAMRQFEALAQASSLDLVQRLNTTIPLTLSSLKAYYAAHTSSYDTLCISVALVPPASVAAFSAAQKSGVSVANLAKKFSLDASAAKGGTYGCYAPASTSYSSVRADVNGLALNTFASSPNYVTVSGATYALYVAVTSRTTTPFLSAERAVLADLQSTNAASANTIKSSLLYRAAIMVDPSFGRWGLASSGPQVFSNAVPAKGDVANAAVFTSPNVTAYK